MGDKNLGERNAKNKTIVKADILLIAGILILAVAGLFAWKKIQKPGAYVDIMVDGVSVKTLDLSEDTTYEVVQTAGNNQIVVKDKTVFVEEADCSDKVCVKHASITKTGETIICLPHKLVVEIKE